MPKIISELKIEYATNLLLEHVPIAKIQEQLHNNFGNGMSPNKLVQLRRNLINNGLIQNPNRTKKVSDSTLSLSIPGELVHSLNNSVMRNSQKIDLLFERMKLFEEIFGQAEFLIEKTGVIEEKLDSLQLGVSPTPEKAKKPSAIKFMFQSLLPWEKRKHEYKGYIIDTLSTNQRTFSRKELQDLTKLDDDKLDEILNELQGIMIKTETHYKAI